MRGLASYYWQGRHTASGQRFNPSAHTCAHRSYPFGTKLEVTLKGKSVTVTVNDRGPFVRGRIIDLSLGAAQAIGLTRYGVAMVDVERVS